jgi:hypothetical protein
MYKYGESALKGFVEMLKMVGYLRGIDRVVYWLYELTEEEVRIVENNGDK